ncbi:hypothetical protein AAFF_G00413520 [Aldrovandia affinis]|uniref:Uncharacterized protein n=1 Tax=Aldrovandia affinis TaxID=143900 RepID=A0AAD7WKG0_9TELE|nr:hypothetical protein AAFF_G00413520 [Aldrovandia affinis]
MIPERQATLQRRCHSSRFKGDEVVKASSQSPRAEVRSLPGTGAAGRDSELSQTPLQPISPHYGLSGGVTVRSLQCIVGLRLTRFLNHLSGLLPARMGENTTSLRSCAQLLF